MSGGSLIWKEGFVLKWQMVCCCMGKKILGRCKHLSREYRIQLVKEMNNIPKMVRRYLL
jgi:hypothetical protein